MSVDITVGNECSLYFRKVWLRQFVRFINRNNSFINGHGETVWIDEAHVLNNLHMSISDLDPLDVKHSTVWVTNGELRRRGVRYTLHWRPPPEGPMDSPEESIFLPWSNEEFKRKKKEAKLTWKEEKARSRGP